MIYIYILYFLQMNSQKRRGGKPNRGGGRGRGGGGPPRRPAQPPVPNGAISRKGIVCFNCLYPPPGPAGVK